MKKATAVYITKPEERQVLLAFKQKVVGINKLFPYGGKFKPEDDNNPFFVFQKRDPRRDQ